MPNQHFPHLNLVFKDKGSAKLEGGGSLNPDEKRNREDRPSHSSFLRGKAVNFSREAREIRGARQRAGLPEIKGGVPFLLKIPDEDDGAIEFIAEKLGIEVVAEFEDGFLIVSSDDLDLQKVVDLADNFAQSARGSSSMAKILDIDENPMSENRIRRILEDRLFEKWPFADNDILILDVSIEVAAFGRPAKPRITRRSRPETKAQKEAEYAEKKVRYLQSWEEKRIQRETEIEAFIGHYRGEICNITDNSHVVEFPDSFSARIRMNGKGFKDLIQNYPNLFEVTVPDEIEQPVGEGLQGEALDTDFELLPPIDGSSSICVIDSGIQENHRWLQAAIDASFSRCFIPGIVEVADHVRDGGHGTRVAGACLYPFGIVKNGRFRAPFWLRNARVLNENNELLPGIFPPELLQRIISEYKVLGTKIYQHSINSKLCCRLSRMSIWASAIDLISYREDVLFIQSAGNLCCFGGTASPGILDHLNQGREYPSYLYESSSRVANPGQSLQALTVGSIAGEFYQDADRRSVASMQHPSSFSRSGFGVWGSIKPEVVEFGGDQVIDSGSPPALSNPQLVCPELIRSTLYGGPPFARDAVGTSFSAPKVAHIAAQLANQFPTQSTLLYRALIVNSARWPQWAEQSPVNDRPNIVRSIGYGIPDLGRATENSENRITLITREAYDIKAKEGFVFGVPIPEELRRPGDDYRIRIDVTLSYSGEPRRTRKSRRGYLGVWLDWKASKKNEVFETFRARALKESDGGDGIDDGNFSWIFGNKKDRDGETDGVSRRNGTVQKDWTIARSYELPDIFGVVVRGHEGWARNNPEATSRFSLVVTFEVLDAAQIRIYERIAAAVQAEIAVQVTAVEVST